VSVPDFAHTHATSNDDNQHDKVNVEVVATKASLTFFDPQAVRRHGVRVWVDEDEWQVRPSVVSHTHPHSKPRAFVQPDYKIGDPILHIELRRWADLVLVAPCSANTLAKIAGGLCDNLAVRSLFLRLTIFFHRYVAWQTSLLRALDPSTPTYVFPAMNTLMYAHPLTSEHLRVVRDIVKYKIVGPIGKGLACGDVGESYHIVYLNRTNVILL
jgi:phosphopantothenoylcysteine decarboxylase